MKYSILAFTSLVVVLMAAIVLRIPVTDSVTAQEPSAPATLTATVTIGPNNAIAYSPSVQIINQDDAVHWAWSSAMIPHSTTSGTCAALTCTPDGKWNSGIQTAPFSFDFTFTSPGSYPYFCLVHGAAMQGTIIIIQPRLYLPLIIR